MMRPIFPWLAMIVLVARPAGAQTNVTGEWEVTVQSPQGTTAVKATLKQEGEKLSGSFRSQMGEVPVTGTITGDDVKIGFTINVQGAPLDITMTGRVDAGSIAGKAQFGGFGDGDWTAKRAPAADAASTASTEPAAAAGNGGSTSGGCVGPAGKWDVTLKTPGGDFPVTATLAQEGDRITGTFATQMGELPVSGTVDGKSLKLAMVAKTPQGDIPVSLTGDLDGDAIANGKAEFGAMGQGEWTAKCKP